jgi:hypothetical protein
MDTISSMSWLVPAWIIGAPLLAALVMLMSTPRGSNRFTCAGLQDRTGMSRTVGSRDGQMLPR